MADLQPFATVEDLTKFWKAPEDEERAEYLLVLASNQLRTIGKDVGVDIDARFDTDEAYATTVQWVVMESVKRALQMPTDQPPVESWAQTAGPYSENYKYSNPSGDIWFKKKELSMIGLYGKQRLNSISTSRTDIYGS